jgi:hypothetical protein
MLKLLSLACFSINFVTGQEDSAQSLSALEVAAAARQSLSEDVADSCPGRPSGSSMLMQFAMKPARDKVAKPEEDESDDKDEKQQPDKKKEDKKKEVPSENLKEILKTAYKNSNKSGQPFEYFLDVDYLHDANNPLDNGGAESKPLQHKEDGDSSKSEDADTKDDSKSPDQGDSDSSGTNTSSKDDGKDKGKGKSAGNGKSKDYATKDAKAISIPGCATRYDSRATSNSFTTVSKAGAHCVFGIDERDEGSHCILSDGSYGTNGWCWTSEDRTTWGSCNEYCPLWGAAGVLEKRIDKMGLAVTNLLKKIRKKKDCGDSKKEKKEDGDSKKKKKEDGDSKKKNEEDK